MEDCRKHPNDQFTYIHNLQIWIQDKMFNVTGITEEKLTRAIAEHDLNKDPEFIKIKA